LKIAEAHTDYSPFMLRLQLILQLDWQHCNKYCTFSCERHYNTDHQI